MHYEDFGLSSVILLTVSKKLNQNILFKNNKFDNLLNLCSINCSKSCLPDLIDTYFVCNPIMFLPKM